VGGWGGGGGGGFRVAEGAAGGGGRGGGVVGPLGQAGGGGWKRGVGTRDLACVDIQLMNSSLLMWKGREKQPCYNSNVITGWGE